MKTITYNRIQGPKVTVNEYVESLKSDELQTVYSSSFLYGIKIPALMKKMENELVRRKLTPQPVLF